MATVISIELNVYTLFLSADKALLIPLAFLPPAVAKKD
jgi:hypothetical protein